jgi:flavin-dependent dehydrogenase
MTAGLMLVCHRYDANCCTVTGGLDQAPGRFDHVTGRRDPLIIGAGPAGTAAAITLGRAGYRPVLVERTAFPADKVCGDFLSVDSIRHAQALGVDPVALGGAPIHRIRLIHGERTAETALPFPAIGLSRRSFDAALLSQAEAALVVVRTGQTVRHLTRAGTPEAPSFPPADATSISDPGRWTARTGDRTAFTADTVFLATGKHDLRDLPRPHTDRDAVGMKMYFALTPDAAKTLDGAIELTLFQGGYAGMQLVEDGKAALCIAIQRHAFQDCGGRWTGLLAMIERNSRRFASMLEGARPLLPRPLAVAAIPYGYRVGAAAQEGLFRLGDQAAVIPSLTGDGMAIALHTGKAAAETWLEGGDSAAYHRALARTLGPQMRLAGLLHRACMSGRVQSSVLLGAALFPALLRYAASRTRLPSPA